MKNRYNYEQLIDTIMSNLLIALCVLMPVALYGLLFYLMLPKYSVLAKHAPLFYVMGLVTVGLIRFFISMFPMLGMPIADDIWGLLIQQYLQVAFIEELFKLIMFAFALRYYPNAGTAALMFMYLSIGAGFAVLENFQYVAFVGSDILFGRQLSATLVHLATGAVGGYFYGKNKWFGLAIAVGLHGSYNFIGMATGSIYGLASGVALCLLSAGACLWSLYNKKTPRP